MLRLIRPHGDKLESMQTAVKRSSDHTESDTVHVYA